MVSKNRLYTFRQFQKRHTQIQISLINNPKRWSNADEALSILYNLANL